MNVLSEINECLDGVCPHTCKNTNGSVECGCYAGYSLEAADRTSCKGMYYFLLHLFMHVFFDSQDQAISINIDLFIVTEKRGLMHILGFSVL